MFVAYSNAMVAIFSSIDTKRNILPIPFLYVNHSHRLLNWLNTAQGL